MSGAKFALVLFMLTGSLLCTSLGAQENSRSGVVREQNADSTIVAKKAVMLSGRVSDGGKLFVSEDQDRWIVSNPGALAPHAGHLVTLKCQVSPDQNSIHVLLVKPTEAKYMAAHNDSAFRR